MTDFSQSGEQQMILDWADRHGSGRFLDIGAADGRSASNTRALALNGWTGVCVEVAAGLFDKLVDEYWEQGQVYLVEAALVVADAELIQLHYTRDLVSTTSDGYRDKWADLVQFRTVYVPSLTVADLLAQLPGPYDMVSVDTEGTSVELWDELRRLDAFAPGALAVIEAEDGNERWEIQQACLEGWARVGVTPNNVLLEKL